MTKGSPIAHRGVKDDCEGDRGRWLAWSLTWIAYASYYFGRKSLSVSKTSMNAELGVSMGAFAAIDTLFLAAYAGGQFVSGHVGDRIGARRLVGYGMLAGAACLGAFGSASGALLFGVLYLVNGLAQSTGWPGTTRAMAEWTTARNRGRVMGFWATCYQIGGGVATVLAAALLGWYGWRATFLAPAVIVAAVGLAVLFFLRPGPRARGSLRDEGAPSAERSVTVDARRLAQRALLRNRRLWCYGASYFCVKLIRYSLLFWLPVFLKNGLGFDAVTAAYVSSGFEWGGPLGVIALGSLSDYLTRWSRPALAAASLIFLAAVLFVYAHTSPTSATVNVALLAAIGFALFGPDALISGAATQDVGGDNAAAMATGFVNGIGSIGGLLSAYVTVWVSDAWGWQSLFYVFLGLAVLAALALVPSFKSPPSARDTPIVAEPREPPEALRG